jgi:hypothetical protein
MEVPRKARTSADPVFRPNQPKRKTEREAPASLSVMPGSLPQHLGRTVESPRRDPDDPEITSGIAELTNEPELTGEVADEWAELNRKLVERAWIAPYGRRKLSTFVSERMDFDGCTLFHPVSGNDYSSFCL